MKSYSELLRGFANAKPPQEPVKVEQPPKIEPVAVVQPTSIREQYVAGGLFKNGEFVKSIATKSTYQVVECCSNYLRVVDRFGKTKRVWLDSVEKIVPSKTILETFAPQIGNQIFFKGYRTKTLTIEMIKAFQPILESNDPFAVLSALKYTDAFNQAKTAVEKHEAFELSGRFLRNLNITEHAYRDNMEAQIAEMLFESIPDIVKITKNDKVKTAQIIASAVGIESKGSPEDMINAAAKEVASGKHGIEVMPIFGELFALADTVGIQWDKTIFTPSQMEKMGLKEQLFNSEWIEHLLSEAANTIQAFHHIADLYEAKELRVVSGKKVTCLEEVEGDSVEQKMTNAVKANPLKDKSPKQVVVAEPSDEKKIARRARQFALKYIRDRSMRHSANKLSEKERKRLEAIMDSKGSIITHATNNLSKKISKVEAERLMAQQDQGDSK